ncbi:MAG: potassium channel family protein [Actinomycetota bacterium]|nr:potassium channel family protein [Actinomycetota bacterium]
MNRFLKFGEGRYGVALLLLLASMVLVMAAGSGTWAETLTMTIQSLALIASIRAALPGGRLRASIGMVIALGVLVVWSQAIFVDRVDAAIVPAATFLLVLIATPVITFGLIKQVRDVGSISIHTMMGVICIYLLLSLAFASSFALVDASIDDPFFKQGEEWSSLRNYLYYSLTTITTVGMGDLTPSGDLGRSLTASEALIGQIYIVTVVALIVGNIGLKRRN